MRRLYNNPAARRVCHILSVTARGIASECTAAPVGTPSDVACLAAPTSKPPPAELLKFLQREAMPQAAAHCDASPRTKEGKVIKPTALPLVPFNPFTGRRVRRVKKLAAIGFITDPADKLRLTLARVPDVASESCQQLLSSREAWVATFRDLLARCGIITAPSGAIEGDDNTTALVKATPSNDADILAKLNAEITSLYDSHQLCLQLPAKLITSVDLNAPVQLTPDQQRAVDIATQGKCMYVSGDAGTGKTVALKAIYAALVNKGLRVALTATTGAAAVNIGASTIHHALAIPMNPAADLHQWDLHTLKAIDVLIVDEISMLGLTMLEGIDAAARHARMTNRWFGGLQLIFSGDFLQLCSPSAQCCSHPVFQKLAKVRLSTNLRHADQPEFLSLLRSIRTGALDATNTAELMKIQARTTTHQAKHGVPLPVDVEESAVFIYPLRRSAQVLNDQRLSLIPAEAEVFNSVLGGATSASHLTKGVWLLSKKPLDKQDVYDAIVKDVRSHKLRWQILFDDVVIAPMEAFDVACLPRMHMDKHLPYAQLCRIVRPIETFSRFRQRHDNATATMEEAVLECWKRIAVGLKCTVVTPADNDTLALSSTMLGSMQKNGLFISDSTLTLKVGCRVVVNRNLSSTVINGSLGVVEGFSRPMFNMFPKSVASCNLIKTVVSPKQFPLLPIVRFTSTNETYQIPPVTSSYGCGPTTHFLGQDVHELPLQLGYAFTVHKVQGVTLDGPVVVNFTANFKCDHLMYVALSRVRKASQLHLIGLDASQVHVCQASADFEKRVVEEAAAMEASGDAQQRTSTATTPSAPVAVGIWASRALPSANP